MLNRAMRAISQAVCGAIFLSLIWPLGGISRLIGNPMSLRRLPTARTYKILAK